MNLFYQKKSNARFLPMKHLQKTLLFCFAFLFTSSMAFSQTLPDVHASHPESHNSSKAELREITVTFGTSAVETTVRVEIVDGLVFLSSDILLGTEAEVFNGAAILNIPAAVWPGSIVPYTIRPGYSSADSAMIAYAINYVGANTNLCLVPRTAEVNYVEFNQEDNACYSYVGMQGGMQPINVVSACGIGATIHEILHAVGHWHEQSRSDRDTYVTIDLTNVPAANQHNFDIYPAGADHGDYDYGSIMHYGETAFSTTGDPSIVVKVPPGTTSTDIGQRLNMSAGDIAAVNAVYTASPACSPITGLPFNLRIKDFGNIVIDKATGMVTVTGVEIENTGDTASPMATDMFLVRAPVGTFSYGIATVTSVPVINAGGSSILDTLTFDGSGLSANNYKFGLWMDPFEELIGEGSIFDNRHFWDAPTLLTPCIVTDGLAGVTCDNSSTNNDITDDKITFTLNPTGLGLGTTYNVTVGAGTITPTSGSYGVATTFALQDGSAGAGNITVTITDSDNNSAKDSVSITDPGSCSSNAVDITFVIDDTGSMSEEISGVRDALQGILSTYDPTAGTVFQLITFKDTFTVFAPTSDLATIQAQVAALSANGGGDCPEASYQALAEALTMLKVGGDLFLATDASPHSGVDIDALIAAAIANGTTISTVLTGDCSSDSFLTDVDQMDAGQEYVPYSDNGGGKQQGVPMTESLTDFSAVSAFSTLASGTGGSFSFVPQVNFGDALDKDLFKNIVTNIVNGAISQAVIDASPSDAPIGSTLNIKLTGANTNFNSSTTVSFPSSFAGGITVNSVNVINATSLEVNVTVDGATSTGLFSPTVTTTVAGGAIETVGGTGIIKVVAAPTNPTILSISPSTGAQGATMNVTISGAATNFTNASVVDLGSGITINAITANSATTITANITIAAGATVGFRDVTVTTGGETATESLSGPFLVTTLTPSIVDAKDDFNISDPCSCSDDQNTTVGGVYLFHDVLTVTGTPAQTVQVIANDGEFRGANDVALTVPLTLSETASGVYQVDFWHRSSLTTTVTVQMNGNPGTDQNFTSSSCDEATCATQEPIPTMNEWGLMIFGLLLLNLGLIFVYRKEALLK